MQIFADAKDVVRLLVPFPKNRGTRYHWQGIETLKKQKIRADGETVDSRCHVSYPQLNTKTQVGRSMGNACSAREAFLNSGYLGFFFRRNLQISFEYQCDHY